MEILGLVNIPACPLLLVFTALTLYLYGTKTYSMWSSRGIPGPKPWPFVGNLPELFKMTQFRAYTEWGKKYGKVYGIFGFLPSLVVCDLNMAKEIMVKNFPNFADRSVLHDLLGEPVNKGLFFLGGTDWKRVRTQMTPSFSTGKLKKMSHFIDRCSKLLRQHIQQEAVAEKDMDIKDIYGGFTMDVIAGTAFGLETNSQTEEAEIFVTNSKKMFETLDTGVIRRMFSYILVSFPALGRLLSMTRMNFGGSEYARFFIKAVGQMIEDLHGREKTHEKGNTYMLQMLVDAETDPETADAPDTPKFSKYMTKEEIVGQGFIVFLAGYETTATTLQYLTYLLTLNPEKQQRIYEEIMTIVGKDDPTYENVSMLKYLDAAIRETLRMFPPVPAVNRTAREAVTIQGITIPKGCSVVLPIYSIMHDPNYFHDPEMFIPERFLQEESEKLDSLLVDLPFGIGPRQCIGMRLALLEIKFAAVRLFRAFRFVKCAATPEKITLGTGFGLSVPDVTIIVKAEPRRA